MDNQVKTRKKLIEVALPLEAINGRRRRAGAPAGPDPQESPHRRVLPRSLLRPVGQGGRAPAEAWLPGPAAGDRLPRLEGSRLANRGRRMMRRAAGLRFVAGAE